MKTFEIKVTQNLTGYLKGTLEIDAETKEEADIKLKAMSKNDIDNSVDWSHGDEYDGDVASIRFETKLTEV